MNAAKCLRCGTVLISQSRHDFTTCACGDLSVDGGEDYVRRCYMPDAQVLEIRTQAELDAALAPSDTVNAEPELQVPEA
jgi:hypothetical protein